MSSSFKSELTSIVIRVAAAGVISYISIKYMIKLLDPNHALKQEAEKKVRLFWSRDNAELRSKSY
jgi:hypothetical protein